MGEFLNAIIWVLGVSVVLSLMGLGSQAIIQEAGIEDSTPVFLWDYMFGEGRTNLLTSQINTSIPGWAYNDIGESQLPGQTVTGTDASGFKIPDWLQSSKNFITSTTSVVLTPVKLFVNIIGFPYTVMVALHYPPDVSALIGGALGTIFFLLLVGFILGRNS